MYKLLPKTWSTADRHEIRDVRYGGEAGVMCLILSLRTSLMAMVLLGSHVVRDKVEQKPRRAGHSSKVKETHLNSREAFVLTGARKISSVGQTVLTFNNGNVANQRFRYTEIG